MTTVAWDGTTLAADCQCSYHGNSVPKIDRLADGSLVGASGDYDAALEAIAFLDKGGSKPDLDDVKLTILVIAPDGSARWMHNRLVGMQVSFPFFAIGSGADYAMGAMAMGATAAEAVAIAARYDEATGGDVATLTLQEP